MVQSFCSREIDSADPRAISASAVFSARGKLLPRAERLIDRRFDPMIAVEFGTDEQERTCMIRLATLLIGITGAAYAQAGPSAEGQMLDALNRYAGHLGALAACDKGPRSDAISWQADKIAQWRYLGWIASLLGDRSRYLATITSGAEESYDIAVAKGCSFADLLSADLLISAIAAEIAQLISEN